MNDKKKWLEAQLKRTSMGIKRLAMAAGFAPCKVYAFMDGHTVRDEQFFIECIEGIPNGKQRNYAEQLKRVRALKLTIYGAAALFKVSYETMHEYFRREKTSNVIYDRIDAWFANGMPGLRKAREQKRCESAEHGCGEAFVRRMLARDFVVTLVPQGHTRPVTVQAKSYGDYLNNDHVVQSREYQPAVCIHMPHDRADRDADGS